MKHTPCTDCIADKKLCAGCIRNLAVPHQDFFRTYNPTCLQGYRDCVCDPAYVKCYHPVWYAELYGNLTPEEAMKINPCTVNEDGLCTNYDTEDK